MSLNKAIRKNHSNFSLSIGIFSLFVATALSTSAFAKATFGAEFNFSNSVVRQGSGSIVNSPASTAARDKMLENVKVSCPECKIQNKVNSYGVLIYKVTYPDGWYFFISTDPAVVEIQTKPSTVDELENLQERMEKDIFGTAREAGLLPATKVMGPQWAGSHIHIGVKSALGEGVEATKKLRNFMTDFSNHSELAEGIFTNDRLNAPPLRMLPAPEKENFKKIIDDVDSGKISNIKVFAERVRNEVYDVTLASASPTTKYQAFNVNRIGAREFTADQQTFEIRAMRGQESAKDFVDQTKLLEARLEYVNSAASPVPLKLKLGAASLEEKAERFYQYVTETGLDFAPYEKLLSADQKRFLGNIKFRANRAAACRALFN
jgi:hypothetical protein